MDGQRLQAKTKASHPLFLLFVFFYVEKHQVILHELSFDERADLKAPDLLGPVFLAVQDDDESEDSFRNRQKLSQSIDDLCEMISEDENEEGTVYTYAKPRTIPRARRINEKSKLNINTTSVKYKW